MAYRMLIRPALIACGIFAAAGCNQVRPPIEPHADPYRASHVHVDSYQLQRDTAVENVIPSRDQGGLLHVVVPIRSVIDKQLHMQYRVRFFDRNRSVVSEIGWTDKTLPANTPDQIEANSSNPAADDFEVDLRYPPGY